MTAIGIDIGTSSVRSYIATSNDKSEFTSHTHPIKRKQRSRSPHVITQSSGQILDAVLATIPLHDLGHDTAAISVSATCSMVVRRKVYVDGKTYLLPFGVEDDQNDDAQHVNNDQHVDHDIQDVILWMDSRAQRQCDFLNATLDDKILHQVGGKIIPEMGLAKLMWLSDALRHDDETELVVFEMYDWFSYVLIHGVVDGKVPYSNAPLGFEHDSSAMDGSIKGWSDHFLYEDMKLNKRITVGRSDSAPLIPAVGQVVGEVHRQFSFPSTCLVGHGCIDCYGGWLSTISGAQTLASTTLSMIAGTSTCFILTASIKESIGGIWGPFAQLMGSHFQPIYQFGQMASGKLFEDLMDEFVTKTQFQADQFFSIMESTTRQAESKLNSSITYILRKKFYYGDKYGNRSPFNDFGMRELILEGDTGLEECELNRLMIRYNLTIEFLVLQMKQLVDIIELRLDKNIEQISVSGSQAKNERMMQMIALVLDKRVTIDDSASTFISGARGASLISRIALDLSKQRESYHDVLTRVIDTHNGHRCTKTMTSGIVADKTAPDETAIDETATGGITADAIANGKTITGETLSVTGKTIADEIKSKEQTRKILAVKYWMLQKSSELQAQYRAQLQHITGSQ